jgi:hypothetical protein
MLGFSLGKIIVLVLIVAAIWYGFKYIAGRNRAVGQGKNRGNLRQAGDDASRNTVHEMETCALCGTFVPVAVAKACGRDGCPYPA